jgi:molybdopterin/thiamine biosynthesis adenylyltransferase
MHGYDQCASDNAHGCVIGCGGIGGELCEGLCRMGVGALSLFDRDVTEFSNLTRQWFYPRDVFRNKAFRLICNLKEVCTYPTKLTGWDLHFEDALALGIDFSAFSFFICGVDNNKTRVAVDRHFRALGVPGIHIGLDVYAASGYVFVQESKSDSPCFQCLFPYALEKTGNAPCFAASSKEILGVVGGLGLFAINSLVCPKRFRDWDYRFLMLNKDYHECKRIQKRPGCPGCANGLPLAA